MERSLRGDVVVPDPMKDVDSSREFGLASMVSLFDDRLVGWYGFNFSQRSWYSYAGWRFRL